MANESDNDLVRLLCDSGFNYSRAVELARLLPVARRNSAGAIEAIEFGDGASISSAQAIALQQGNILASDGRTILPSTSLIQTAVPFCRVPAGTMGNNGAVTWATPAARFAFPACYIHLPAGAIQAGSAVGWYYASFSTTQAATVYQETYTNGKVPVYDAPTPWVSTGPGAFTVDITTDIPGPSITVPGLAMGVNGALRIAGLVTNINSGTGKVNRVRVGGTNTVRAANQTTAIATPFITHFMNGGALNRQFTVDANNGDTASASAVNTHAINTANPFALDVSLRLNATTDYMACERLIVELLPMGA